MLRRNAYRPWLMKVMGLSDGFFHVSTALQRDVPVLRLTRPFEFAAMPGVIAALEAHWRALGLAFGD